MVEATLVRSVNTQGLTITPAQEQAIITAGQKADAVDVLNTNKKLGNKVITPEDMKFLSDYKDGQLYRIVLVDKFNNAERDESGRVQLCDVDGKTIRQAYLLMLTNNYSKFNDPALQAARNIAMYGTKEDPENDRNAMDVCTKLMNVSAQLVNGRKKFQKFESQLEIVEGAGKGKATPKTTGMLDSAVMEDLKFIASLYNPAALERPAAGLSQQARYSEEESLGFYQMKKMAMG